MIGFSLRDPWISNQNSLDAHPQDGTCTNNARWTNCLLHRSFFPATCRVILPVLVVLACFLPANSSPSGLKQVRKVLLINDLGIVSSPGFAEVDQSIFNALQNSPYRVELYHESLQLTFFPDEFSRQAFSESLLHKYSEHRPDVIIAAGSASLQLLAESSEPFIRETPIIFCAVLGDVPEQMKSGLHLTGVLARPQPEDTLKTALHLLPGTKHVVILGGVGKFDEQWERIAEQSFRSYKSKLDFTYLNNLAMPELLDRIGHLPSGTIVYHTSIAEDVSGERFIGAGQSVPLVANAANAPVFVMDDVDLKAGTENGAVVGGDLVNWVDDGRLAGEIAVRVLNGEKPETIPLQTSPLVYMFDSRALRRFGISERDLPSGSLLLHRQPTLWEQYKAYVVVALLTLVVQAAIILALLFQRRRRRIAEAALKHSEEKFSKAFQRSPLAFTLASLRDYRFIEVNDTFESYTGWTRNEVIGRTPLELKFWAQVNQRSAFLEQIRAQGAVKDMEIDFQRKDGQVRTGLLSSELIDLSGEPCAVSLIADVTDAKRAEAEKRESEERFRLVASIAPVMIWMSRPDKLCDYFNQPWLDFTGRTLEQEIGNGWMDGVHPDDRAACMDIYTQCFDRRDSFKMEYRLRRHDGEYRWVSDIGVPRLEPDGRFAGYIGSCIDTTDRKLAEEALANVGRRLIEAHEEERTWIARELHDDINQRIALLAVELTQFEQQHDSEPETFHGLTRIRQCLLDLGRDVQALSHRLHSSKLDYLGLAAAARGFCNELAEQHKVQIDFQQAGIPSSLSKEISLCLFRVLQEALQNAVKHSGARHFAAELLGSSEEIQLTVKDFGVGFDQQSAFQRHGFGLISMRERLQLVNGNLSIKSELHRGTTVYARVPFKTEGHRAGRTA